MIRVSGDHLSASRVVRLLFRFSFNFNCFLYF